MLHEPLSAAPARETPERSSGMRIVVCDYSGHAFPAQLSRELARRGHDVLHLYFAEFPSPKGRLHRLDSDPATFAIEAISLGRPFSKHRLVRRRFEEIEIGRRFAARIAAFSPDIVVGGQLPLDALTKVIGCTKRLGCRFVFWQQDIYSVAIERILTRRLGPVGAIIGRHYKRLEKAALEASDAIIAISPDFVSANAHEFGIEESRIHVIENWASLEEIRPAPKDNAWSRKHGLTDREVVLYTGTLGMKHDPSRLLELARALAKRPSAVLVVVSEGPAADWLATKGAELSSLRVLPFQAYSDYSNVLASADVLVAVLEADAGEYSVPSKILSYLCSGRAIVLSAPPENLASCTIVESGAGLVVDGANPGSFVTAILRMIDDRDARSKCGTSGRTYAARTFDIGLICDRFERSIALHTEDTRR